MRIIKQGVIPQVQHYQTTCNNCKTEFEFSEDDGAWVCGSHADSVLSLSCPFCHKSVSVKIPHNEVCNEVAPTKNPFNTHTISRGLFCIEIDGEWRYYSETAQEVNGVCGEFSAPSWVVEHKKRKANETNPNPTATR